MRLLFVSQRYGPEVAGGAETACREVATRLAARGHRVEVLTTCALRYSDWADHYEPGESTVEGVVVHRLPVARPRDQERFADLDARLTEPGYVPRWLEEEWMRLQGPDVPELVPWLVGRASGFDACAFFTYLYATTWAGLPAAAATTPTVLVPTAHDEAPLYRTIFDDVFRRATAFAFLTPEEEELVRRRFGVRAPGEVVGLGVGVPAHDNPDAPDPDASVSPRHGRRVLEELGLDDRPYLLYLGRFDVGKAAEELVTYFAAYKERNPGPLALALVGEPVQEPPEHPDLVVTGFVDEEAKHAALAGARALVLPSYFESFSIALVEGWAHGVPGLVQGRCDVLAGQVRRSGGGLPYEGFAEFEAAVDALLDDDALRRELGEAGRRYAREHYAWERVIDRYEALLEAVTDASARAADTR